MASIEERVSRIEGGYEHLATKADVAEIRGELIALEGRLMMKLGSLIVVATGIIVAAMRLWQ